MSNTKLNKKSILFTFCLKKLILEAKKMICSLLTH